MAIVSEKTNCDTEEESCIVSDTQAPVKQQTPATEPQNTPQVVNSEAIKGAADCSIGYTQIMRAICQAESGGNSQAVGDDYVIAGLYAPSCGLWQIRTLAGRPSCDELKDPQTNLEWAWKISNQGANWSPWSVYKSGKYLQFMK